MPDYIDAAFDHLKPTAVVLTHPMTSFDYPIFMAAKQRGIRTLGVIKSWDNIRKGLICSPDRLSVWNSVNAEEAVKLQGYDSSDVAMNGAISFDPYFPLAAKDQTFLRETFNIPAGRRIITYATSGVFDKEYYYRDETDLARELLRAIATQPRLHDCHLVIRLHPVSRYEQFEPFLADPRVSISHGDYLPSLGWYVGQQGLRVQTELLNNSDVIVTPCSSWAIEAAIFDTPTVCPVYSTLQPDHARAQFDDHTLRNHFAPIARDALIPLPRTLDETVIAIATALENPADYAQQRAELTRRYVEFGDNQSHRRVARWIVENLS